MHGGGEDLLELQPGECQPETEAETEQEEVIEAILHGIPVQHGSIRLSRHRPY
jgi:hypothetical protein